MGTWENDELPSYRHDTGYAQVRRSKRSAMVSPSSYFRCALLFVAGTLFIGLQIVFFASLLPNINGEAADVSKELVETLFRRFVEPTADAAEPEEASESLFPPPFLLPTPPASAPAPAPPDSEAHAPGADAAADAAATASTRTDASRREQLAKLKYAADVALWRAEMRRAKAESASRFVWDFRLASTFSHDVTLLGCLGNGTYGTVLNASLKRPNGVHEPVVVKLPVLRHWGFKFFRAEQRALAALDGLNGAPRNVIQTYGNTTFSISTLLRLSRGQARHRHNRRRLAAEEARVYDYNDDNPFGAGHRTIGQVLSATDEGEAEEEADGDVAAEIARWSCLNQTDLMRAHTELKLSRLPAILLEPLQTTSVFKWLATVAADDDGDSANGPSLPLEAQRHLFRAQLERHARTPGAPLRDAFRSGLTLLIGVARGLAALGRARVLHRDLTEPGKNALLKRDAIGLTASLIDLSQAEVCPAGRGAVGRAIDLYSYGNLLFYACYGVVAHSLPWTKYSCLGTPGKHLIELLANHRRLHGADESRSAPPSRFNRCHERIRAPLDRLMQYCWAPGLAAAKAAEAAAAKDGPNNDRSGAAGQAAARLNHSWPAVITALEQVRKEHVPLFRFL